jgi:hypothetical protein
MKTLTVSAHRVNKPAPVRSTVVLFDGGRRHVVRDFGRGILRSLPTTRRTWTDADAAWAAEVFNATAYDRHVDELDHEVDATDPFVAGCLL